MGVYLGNTEIGQMYLGSTEIAEAYLGSTKVYSSSLLPTGYTELPYVSSVDSGGWVDTDILPSDTLGFKVTLKTHVVNPRDATLIGAREDSGNTRYTFGVYNGTGYAGWLTFPSSSERIAMSADTWYLVQVNWKNSRVWSLNTTSKSLSGTQGTFTHTIQLFGSNSYNGHSNGRECSIGRITFTLGTDIIADMIPCTSPNNEVGFYDIVRERFFGSGNGTPLIAGS